MSLDSMGRVPLSAVVDDIAAPARSVRFEPPDDEGVARILIDRADSDVNAIDPALVEALAAAVDEARATHPRGLVVASAKAEHFVGGADLTLLRQATREQAAAASRALQRALAALADLPCTVVAAINGSALGAGCEIALACDWRVAGDSAAVRIGQPEVQLGLIPAAGGTQRLPRLVGLPRALDLILAGRRLSARRALRAGLVDEVVHPAALARASRDVALRSPKRGLDGARTAYERMATNVAPARALAIAQARRRALEETRGHYPAPLRAIEAIEVGLRHGVAAGLDAESGSFGELAVGEVSRNLVALFRSTLAQRGAARAGLAASARPLRRVGVVGAGFMGSGIAQAAAVAGLHVRVREVDVTAVARGVASARHLTEEGARKGVFEPREAARIVGRISGTTDLSGFSLVDLVVEAVFEDLALKRRVIGELEEVARVDAVIASNTSALPIREIAAGARRPERIVGMHFFSPVHRMPLVEVVRPDAAEDAAIATAVAAAQALGKTAIVVRDGPGFYTTRVIAGMHAEALRLLEEGARVDAVDAAMTAFGWPIGPFALLDEVGLEVAWHAGETVARALGAEQPHALGLLLAQGRTGKRGGAGFYLYRGGRRAPDPHLHELIGVAPRAPAKDVAEHLTIVFVNEAVRCLDEGVVRSAEEGDLGAVLGLGFPPFLGGPFRYADAKRLYGARRFYVNANG